MKICCHTITSIARMASVYLEEKKLLACCFLSDSFEGDRFSLSFRCTSTSAYKRVNQTINQLIHFSSTQREIQSEN